MRTTRLIGLCSLCLLTSCARHIVRPHFGAPPDTGTTCNAKNSGTSQGHGSLAGVVIDPTGAVIQNADVSTCVRGIVRKAKTSADGTFLLNDLPFGVYSVFVSSPGFAKTQVNDLTVREVASARVTLRVGSNSVSSTSTPEPTPELPPFPVNPPWASSRMQLPPFPMMQAHTPHRLGDYDRAISNALEQFGYSTKGYYYYPGGFALATRLEQIKQDGESLAPPDRFSKLPPAPKTFSVDYLRHIFIPRTGFFRIIVFIVTDQAVNESNETTTSVVAEGWPHHGVPALPSKMANTLTSPAETVSAYVYEFENTTAGDVSDLTLLNPSTIPADVSLLDAEQHLRESHLWGALGLP